MIPYIQFTSFAIGPITIQVWGLMVSLGVLAALLLMSKKARQRSLNYKLIPDLGFWVLLSALLGGRIFFVISEIAYYKDHVWNIFKFWQGGMSISGGFVMAILMGYIFCKKNKLDFKKYLEVGIFSLPLGLLIGRLGCFFIFDHPGKETTFFLGERYMDGLIRHNHGLYLSLNGLFLFILFLILNRLVKNKSELFFTNIFLFEYSIVRFWLDFKRIADHLFFGLTIAQYLAILMFITAIILLLKQFSTVKKT